VPIERVTHVGVCVTDLERSIAFYRDLLGFEYLSEIHVVGEPSDTLLALKDVDLKAAYLERDGLRLELLLFASPKSPGTARPRAMNDLGFTHLSIRVSELAEVEKRLRAAGVTVIDATRIDIPAFEAAAVMIEDPDGLRIELVQAPGDPALPPQV
jgi:catechol 2,3-dioxygenase-like lactoylglutathione lyase family enzyme